MTELVTTKPGDKYRSIKNPRVYEALRRQGHDKTSAARISNAQKRRKKVARKSYTLDDLEHVALKEADPVRAAIIATQLDAATLKGEQLAPGVTRIRGNLCNVHGRWGSCSAAGYGRGEAPVKGYKPLPKGAAGKRGGGRKGGAGKGRAPARQSQAQREAERNKRAAARGAEHETARMQREIEKRNREAERQKKAAARAADRETARMQREIERRNREAERKKRGGGGGKGKQPVPAKAAALPRGTATAPHAPQAPKAGGGGGKGTGSGRQLPAELLDAIEALSEGKPIDDATANKLVQNGLAWRHHDGTVVLTVRGSRALRTKSFTVFKDASGAYRWIARTTTAYRDRDGEIISIKALEEDAARMTASGQYGPLRYWHVGQPDPLNAEAPWGPGLDIGDCDFSIVVGRTSIESGTFKSAEIGAAFAESADEYELSPGFFHAIGEPDASSVFNHIRRFERSSVPVKHGRASNLFTGLTTVKEHHMDQKTYEARVKTYLDFAREKGVPPEIAAAPLAAMQQADKTAEERHVAYKEAGPIDWLRAFFTGEQPQAITKEETPPERTPDLHPDAVTKDDPDGAVVTGDVLAALKAELASLRTEVAALKAPPPPPGSMDAEDDPAQGGDAGADEAAEGEPPIDEGGDGGLTLSADDLAAIGQVISATLEPLIGALGITQKLEGHLGELKTMMSGYTTQKDAAQATQTEEIATLKTSIEAQQAKLAELTGDAPRAGYRPTQATDNAWTDLQVLAAIKENGGGNGFEDLTSKLFPGILPPN